MQLFFGLMALPVLHLITLGEPMTQLGKMAFCPVRDSNPDLLRPKGDLPGFSLSDIEKEVWEIRIMPNSSEIR